MTGFGEPKRIEMPKLPADIKMCGWTCPCTDCECNEGDWVCASCAASASELNVPVVRLHATTVKNATSIKRQMQAYDTHFVPALKKAQVEFALLKLNNTLECQRQHEDKVKQE